jgi:hypothetical protein
MCNDLKGNSIRWRLSRTRCIRRITVKTETNRSSSNNNNNNNNKLNYPIIYNGVNRST